MTGLDLETFLRLLRADLGAWASLGAIVLVLALMTWTSWGSRRALRKCLVLSIVIHLGLVAYGRRIPIPLFHLRGRPPGDARAGERIKEIRVTPVARAEEALQAGGPNGRQGRRLADWEKVGSGPVAMAGPDLRPDRIDAPRPAIEAPGVEAAPVLPETALPRAETPDPPAPDDRPEPGAVESDPVPRPEAEAPDVADDVATAVPDLDESREKESEADDDPTPLDLPAAPSPELPSVRRRESSAPTLAMPIGVGRVRPRADRLALATPSRLAGASPLPLDRATPAGAPRLPEIPGAGVGRPLPDVPEVYRSRLDPNRSARAQRAGASRESEQAVERSLEWLARHQDADGRWNGGTAKTPDGTPGRGESNFTAHCPAGDVCFGECFYGEADTAMTGLALLAYLGAGYTHTDGGKHAPTVEKGLQFLLSSQKPNGDLRGDSEAVGMYCHAMASLALCEAYALTGDERLRRPVEKAVAFVVKAGYPNGLGWRYAPKDEITRSPGPDGQGWQYTPHPPVGDTSILGWVVLLLKSAKVVGIDVPTEVRSGAIAYLDRVADGRDRGLATYQPGDRIKATMTAEAWVCRQFLGLGGPGAASAEAAEFLLAHGPDRDPFNLYYWYYGTLAMYQHGGPGWQRWNAQVRDQIVRHQEAQGHRAGSWDPTLSKDKYDSKGGRIYCTALATLTLEVYYRYLRLYDAPGAPPMMAPAPERPEDASLRRAGGRAGVARPKR